jgi:predicted lipid-binding transport protein (Tim44 family)
VTTAHLVVQHAFLLRAGGGQGFSGGGGFGGGGGYSGGGYYGGGSYYGGGGLGSLGLLSLLFFGGGPIFFIFLLLAAFNAWRRMSYRGAPSHVPRTGSSGYQPSTGDDRPMGVPAGFGVGQQGPPAVDTVAAGIEAIRAHDPQFDDTEFINLAQREFFIVEKAWSDCKPEESRRVMSDTLWDQHRAQIEQYVAKGQRNVLDNLALAGATIVSAGSDARHDHIQLRMHAACADYDVDVATNKIVRGDRSVREWYEDWLFERSSKAVTRPDGGTMAQHCPNCGAPLDVDLSGVCSYCKAPVMSGDYDWVLARIDQV